MSGSLAFNVDVPFNLYIKLVFFVILHPSPAMKNASENVVC